MTDLSSPGTITPTDGYVVDQRRSAAGPGWLSPLTRRRWANFKANRRGYVSLWIISILVVLSLFAEFIANDKPIVMGYKGELYAPVLFFYPETNSAACSRPKRCTPPTTSRISSRPAMAG